MRTLAYKHRDTPLHRAPAAPKAVFVLAAFVVLMVMDDLLTAVIILAASVVLLAWGRCLGEWALMAKLMAVLSLIVFTSNFLLSSMGGAVYWEYGPLPWLGTLDLTSEELLFSLTAAVRLLAVVSLFLVLTLTVSPDELFRMAYRRLPSRTSLLMSLTAVLYPSMVRDAAGVADAHRSRGLEMERGGLVARLRAALPILRPLFCNAM